MSHKIQTRCLEFKLLFRNLLGGWWSRCRQKQPIGVSRLADDSGRAWSRSICGALVAAVSPLHKADATLDHPPRQQAHAAKRFGLFVWSSRHRVHCGQNLENHTKFLF